MPPARKANPNKVTIAVDNGVNEEIKGISVRFPEHDLKNRPAIEVFANNPLKAQYTIFRLNGASTRAVENFFLQVVSSWARAMSSRGGWTETEQLDFAQRLVQAAHGEYQPDETESELEDPLDY